jgi:hypothetical protein
MALQSTSIGTSATTLYTSSGDNAITNIMFCNTVPYNPASPSTGLAYLTVYLVKNTESPTTTNMVINYMPIPAGETFSFDNEKIILANGDSVRAVADVTATLVATVSSLPV